MSTYVLIHGASDGGFVWEKVAPLLEEKGHRVEAPDLPGHGQDKTPIPEISLQSYADRVCEVLDAQPEPVILVGHSSGGVAITQAAEYRPDKVRSLVYLAAYLPRNSESLIELAESDTEEQATEILIMHEDEGWLEFREDAVKEFFGADVPDEDWAHYASQMGPEPIAPHVIPVHTTEENFGRIPRVYIETLRDKGISPSLQKRMYTAVPCQKVISMDTSHSPMLAAPEQLVAHLSSLGVPREAPISQKT